MKRVANDGPEPGRRWRQGIIQYQRASPDRGFCRLDRSGKTLKSSARATVCFAGWPGAPAPARSSYIRERARTLGMSVQDLADRVGVSYGYLSQVSRGRRNMGVKLQARVEEVLETPGQG